MTKTVTGDARLQEALQEQGIDIETPVVDAFPQGRAPSWVEQWKADDRKAITIADLMFMRSGLALGEGYGPTGDVVQMLYGEQDMSAWAASHPLDHQPATYWEYLSASTNILAEVVRAQFATDQDYVDYAYAELFEPLGVTTATLSTDTSGTWVGSSYLWASTADWARLGQLMLDDGRWEGRQIIPTGWWKLAGTPAMPTGEGHGYGAQTWIPGEPDGGECATTPGYPRDALLMEGHYGPGRRDDPLEEGRHRAARLDRDPRLRRLRLRRRRRSHAPVPVRWQLLSSGRSQLAAGSARMAAP